ncbi:MAG: hypothetical protein ACXVCP_13965 [Bdellovibrio sp.]
MKAFLYSILVVGAASSAMGKSAPVSCRQEIALVCDAGKIDSCELPYAEVHQCVSVINANSICSSADKKYVIDLQSLTFSLETMDRYGGVGTTQIKVNGSESARADILVTDENDSEALQINAPEGTLYANIDLDTLKLSDATYFPDSSSEKIRKGDGTPVGVALSCSQKK